MKTRRGVLYWSDVGLSCATVSIAVYQTLFADRMAGVVWLALAIGFHSRWRLNDLEPPKP